MSEDNLILPQEEKLISQAKKRLLGAFLILLILLISAPFILKNRNVEGPTESIKISFESSPFVEGINDENIKLPEPNLQNQESITPPAKKDMPLSSDIKVEPETTIPTNSDIYIQLGIFSDIEKVKSLQQKLNLLNIQTKSEVVNINGVNKVRLITNKFKTDALAKETLVRIRNAGIPGIIKKIN